MKRAKRYKTASFFGERSGVGLLEVLIAFLILGLLMLPIFMFLNHTVKESELLYTEAVAISHAKFVMDTMLFQIPWILIQDGGKFGYINDPKGYFNNTQIEDSVRKMLDRYVPRMFGEGTKDGPMPTAKTRFKTDGLWECPMGFKYRIRLKSITIGGTRSSDNIEMPLLIIIPNPGGAGLVEREVFPNELIPQGSDGGYNIMKKLVLEIRWSNIKGVDPSEVSTPQESRYTRSIHLVAIKSDLEEYR